MGNSIKKQLERTLAGNQKLNQTAIQLKKSWKEVCSVLEKKKK